MKIYLLEDESAAQRRPGRDCVKQMICAEKRPCPGTLRTLRRATDGLESGFAVCGDKNYDVGTSETSDILTQLESRWAIE